MDTPFHTHLDICQQCRDHPFALCEEGERLLKEQALQGTYTGPIGGGYAFNWHPDDGHDFTPDELH